MSTNVAQFLAEDHPTAFSFEVLPPVRGKSIEQVFRSIDRLMPFNPAYINITTHRSEVVYREVAEGVFQRTFERRRPGTVAIAAALKFDPEGKEPIKAFCDENRIRILQILKDGEKCACRLLEALNITQPTLSHHMKTLLDSGVVNGRKEGKWMYYSISEEGLKKAQEYIDYLKGEV